MTAAGTAMTVRVLGSATVVPRAGQETASLLLNDDCLVDCGWCAPQTLLRQGCDPMAVDSVFLTHCHHDHYLGLAPLIFYHAMRCRERPNKPPLQVFGPQADTARVVQLALDYLQQTRFPKASDSPKVIGLAPGDSAETPQFRVSTCDTRHPVQGLCYRFEHRRSGAILVVTGDTAPHPPIVEHANGADLLVHEASFGPKAAQPGNPWGHSGAVDAAQTAAAATVRRLALIHYAQADREAVETAAQDTFPATTAAVEGDVFRLP